MQGERILIVEGEAALAATVADALAAAGFEAEAVATIGAARAAIHGRPVGAVLLDPDLPDGDGLTLLDAARAPDGPVFVVHSARADPSAVVRAVRLGASDFLAKPAALESLRAAIAAALAERGGNGGQVDTGELAPVAEPARAGPAAGEALARIAGDHPSIHNLRELVRKVASHPAGSVLLLGESGTGKSLVAHAIHDASPRGGGPFIDVCCGAIPPSLFENELFGHEAGAFTDAREQKRGLVELACGGTLFLDELEDMPLAGQAKILRFLETHEIYRLGGTAPVRLDVRLVAATHREPADLIEAGRLREDFYYRIAVLPIRLPPLRERLADLPRLAASFGVDPLRIAPDAIAALGRYSWPGNVREFRNVLERVSLAAGAGPIRREHLPPEVLAPQNGHGLRQGLARPPLPPSGISLEEVEANLLAEALSAAGGNKSKAARLLSLTRDTLRYRLKKYGLAQSPRVS